LIFLISINLVFLLITLITFGIVRRYRGDSKKVRIAKKTDHQYPSLGGKED